MDRNGYLREHRVTALGGTDNLGQAIARSLKRYDSDLIRLWESLSPLGPTFGSVGVGSDEDARSRFLRPLAGVMIGALMGSAEHRAVYLDERLRYLPADIHREARPQFLRTALEVELPAIAELCYGLDHGEVLEELHSLHRDLVDQIEPDMRLLFVGDCLFVETRAFLTPLARDQGRIIDVQQTFFSANQQLERRNEAVVSLIRAQQPDIVGVSLFTFEGIPPYQTAWHEASLPWRGRKSLSMVGGLVEVLDALIGDIRSVSNCTIVVHSPGGLPLDRYRKRLPFARPHSRAQRKLVSALSGSIAELVAGSTNVIHLDESALLPTPQAVRSTSDPIFASTDVPAGYFHATKLGPLIAQEYDSICADWLTLRRAKAILVDFDNTLWRGVMADGDVQQDLPAQRLLLELRNAGIILIALSKNDPANIRWGEMMLTPDDFALLKINWRPKPDNVSEAIHELDLAPSAFVLLDDNPVERSLVTEAIQGIVAFDPTVEASWRAMRNWLAFPSTAQTDEAKRRTQMYREAATRRSAMNVAHDYGSMMDTLKLSYALRPATKTDLPRLLELVQRTNQFNTTTIRRSQSDIESLLVSEETAVYVASLKDRFGDLGVVATVFFDRDTHTFESVIMSCRAMGFGLERAILSRVIEIEGGDGEVYGLFIATDRNGPASQLFAEAGFVGQDNGRWGTSRGAESSRSAGLAEVNRRCSRSRRVRTGC